MSGTIPAIVLGAGGYVGGELLRLIAAHPRFDLAAAVSDSRAGAPIGDTFGHLSRALGEPWQALAVSGPCDSRYSIN